ncbi:MAG: PIN domain-containing protein [Deltaproteobacteria bacterium]|nr:PIN domain-containing protein [Deltaproteobacteria bacterium]
MRRFFDTNVLVYVFDSSAPNKRTRALQVLEQAIEAGLAVLSTQVLQEFFVTVTRKLPVPLTSEQAKRAVRDFAKLSVVQIDPEIILNAIETTQRYRLSFWDSLIIQSALRGGATILYSEDLQPGRTIETLKVENPFLS